jgi:hypothetical protein
LGTSFHFDGFRCHQSEGCTMSSLRAVLAAMAVTLFFTTGAVAQTRATKTAPPNTSPTSATTANPQLQRQLSPQQRTSKKQRRANCERQAAQSNMSRLRFMRQCLKG